MLTGGNMTAEIIHIRTVVVDDSPIFLRTVCTFLARYKGIDVVATAESAFEAYRAVDRLRPDLVLLDFHLPRVNGLVAMEQIHRRFPATHVVILTGYDQPGTAESIPGGRRFCFHPEGGCEPRVAFPARENRICLAASLHKQ